MTTLNTRSQTDLGVLPQPQALESVGADTPEGGHETAHGHRLAAVPGVQPGRGETGQAAPSDRRHPEGATAPEGAGRSAHPAVFVLDRHGQPLATHAARPTRANCCVRAGPWSTATPRSSSGCATAQPPTPPSTACRSVSTPAASTPASACSAPTSDGSRTGLYSIQLDHRGGRIRDRLTARAALRRGRRSRNLRYRAPRFNNRTKPQGWLAPSLRHRVDTTMSQVVRLTRWAPVTAVHVETGLLRHPRPVGGQAARRGGVPAGHPGRVRGPRIPAGQVGPRVRLLRRDRCAVEHRSHPPAFPGRLGPDQQPDRGVHRLQPGEERHPDRGVPQGSGPPCWRRSSGRRRLHCGTPPPSTPPGGRCGGRWNATGLPIRSRVRRSHEVEPLPYRRRRSRTRWTRCTSANWRP